MKLISFVLFLAVNFSSALVVNASQFSHSDYKVNIGKCPSKTVGKLVLLLFDEYQKNKSLYKLKKKIVKEQLTQKYYISDYFIEHDRINDQIYFKFDCPEPLLKVQIYKDKNKEYYSAIMVDNGEIFDANYEVVLRSENKIKSDLPYFSIPYKEFDREKQIKVSRFIKLFDESFREKISELIINSDNELIILLSIKNKPISVFLGKDIWNQKAHRLTKIVKYLKKQNKYPSVINLTSSKKVVVKFSNTL